MNGVEKKSFYFSKYQNVVFENRAYSLSRREPLTSINHDTAKAYCTNKGKGFHLATVAEWAYIALWCRKNGTMPHGNNNYGCDINHAYETGTEASKDGNRTGKILTGSGPVTWNHNHQGDYHWFNPSGERLPLCGGDWGNGASAGVFGLHLDSPRSNVYWTVGFRSAFVDL